MDQLQLHRLPGFQSYLQFHNLIRFQRCCGAPTCFPNTIPFSTSMPDGIIATWCTASRNTRFAEKISSRKRQPFLLKERRNLVSSDRNINPSRGRKWLLLLLWIDHQGTQQELLLSVHCWTRSLLWQPASHIDLLTSGANRVKIVQSASRRSDINGLFLYVPFRRIQYQTFLFFAARGELTRYPSGQWNLIHLMRQ